MRISDWSSDVCSSDLLRQHPDHLVELAALEPAVRIRTAHQREERVHRPVLTRRLGDDLLREHIEWLLSDSDPVERTLKSEGRRVGNECVSTCSSRWSPDH